MKVTYGAIVQSASGKFGGTVHSNWKGVQVVRRFAKPSNPNSAGQQAVRNIFANLTLMYLLMPPYVKGAWNSWVVGKPLIGRNKLIADNVPLLIGATNMDDLLVTPGDSSTLPPAAFIPIGGAGQITTTITAPAIPTGWSIDNAIACCIPRSSDPDSDVLSAAEVQIYEENDATAPYTPAITGLTADEYDTWAFIQWIAPDGSTRYSAPIAGGPITVT